MIQQKITFVNKNRSTKFDKKRQRQSFRIKSAIRAATKTKRIFLTFTVLVYIAIVYKVVSVDPIIVDAINPNCTINSKIFHNI